MKLNRAIDDLCTHLNDSLSGSVAGVIKITGKIRVAGVVVVKITAN